MVFMENGVFSLPYLKEKKGMGEIKSQTWWDPLNNSKVEERRIVCVSENREKEIKCLGMVLCATIVHESSYVMTLLTTCQKNKQVERLVTSVLPSHRLFLDCAFMAVSDIGNRSEFCFRSYIILQRLIPGTLVLKMMRQEANQKFETIQSETPSQKQRSVWSSMKTYDNAIEKWMWWI